MHKKSILITGCSSGIGYSCAQTLHKRGWKVFATCRKQKDCNRLKAEGIESFLLDYQKEKTIKLDSLIAGEFDKIVLGSTLYSSFFD